MFDPDGVRSEQFDRARARPYVPVTGFMENWGASLGLTVDQYLPLSSMQDPWSTYEFEDFFGTSRKLTRRQHLEDLIDSGAIPPEVHRQFTRGNRGRTRTDWNKIAVYANENLSDIDHIMTDEEYDEAVKEELANRRRYAEEIQSRADMWGVAGQFAGSMHAMALDPISIVTMPLSAPAVGVARTSQAMYTTHNAARIAAFNMGIQTVMEPFIYEFNERIDSEYTWKDSLWNIGATGILSGTLGGVSSNIGWRITQRDLGAFLSKDYDSLVEAFKRVGADDLEAEDLAQAQWEFNNAVEKPEIAVASDIQARQAEQPEIELTPEEKQIIRKREQEAVAEKELRQIEQEDRKAKKKQRHAEKRAKIKEEKAKAAEAEAAKQQAVFEETKAMLAKIAEEEAAIAEADVALKKQKKAEAAAAKAKEKEAAAAAKKAAAEKKKAEAEKKKAETAKKKAEAEQKKAEKALKAKEKETPPEERPGVPYREKFSAPIIDEAELDRKGRTMMQTPYGKYRIQVADDGTYEVWQGKEMITEGFEDLEDIKTEFGAYETENVTVNQFMEELENKTDEINSHGLEAADDENLFGSEFDDYIDEAYENLDDDFMTRVNGEEMNARDFVESYDALDDEFNDYMSCRIDV